MKNIKIAMFTISLSLICICTKGQSFKSAFVEYLIGNPGISLRAGNELGFKQKELKSNLLNKREFFLRSQIGLMQMDRHNQQYSLGAITGIRFYNQRHRISVEPINIGLGYAYSVFRATAFRQSNGTFENITISDNNHSLTAHLQGFALGYTFPFEKFNLNLRLAPELIAYIDLQKMEGSEFGGMKRTPKLYFYIPVSVNLKF